MARPPKKKRSPHYKGDNAGGFGNPPVKNQFDGQPGPGRPTGSKNSITTELKKAFSEPMTVKDKDGKIRKIIPTRDIARRAVLLGVGGKSKDNDRAIKLAKDYGPDDGGVGSHSSHQQDLSKLSDTELALYGYIAAKVAGAKHEFDPETQDLFTEIEEIISQRKSYPKKH